MLYFGVKERKKMVVVCALLEHEIIMMIPAVAEPVVEFKLLKKCLRYSGATHAPVLGKIAHCKYIACKKGNFSIPFFSHTFSMY